MIDAAHADLLSPAAAATQPCLLLLQLQSTWLCCNASKSPPSIEFVRTLKLPPLCCCAGRKVSFLDRLGRLQARRLTQADRYRELQDCC